jgi:hypothetical protein
MPSTGKISSGWYQRLLRWLSTVTLSAALMFEVKSENFMNPTSLV